MKKLGVVTIGQAPRVDVIPEIRTILGEDVKIIEKGALDGLTLEEVRKFYPEQDDEVLVTRMADGTSVTIAERYVYPRLQDKVKSLEREGVRAVLIACTGEFPPFDSSLLIVYPQKVLYHVVLSLGEGSKLGVLIPDELQVDSTQRRWSRTAREVVVEAASPYGELQEIEVASKLLSRSSVDLVVMDCIGYTMEMKELVSTHLGKPVLLARSIAAKVASELL